MATMHAPFYNYGFQNLGHFFPACSPPPLIPKTVVFQNPNNGVFQASHEPRNVYFYAWKTCIASQFCDFNAAVHIKIDEEVKRALSTVHLRHLAEEFNISMD